MQALKMSKTKLGTDHPSTILGMASLASTYECQCLYEESEHLLMPVIEARKRKIGVDHPDMLMSIVNLAWTGNILVKILKLAKQKQIMGPNHCQTNSTSEILLLWEQWEQWEQMG